MYSKNLCKTMDKGRFAIFFTLVVFLGLLQMWVLVVVMRVIGQPIGMQQLLGDGGLFFFANSLTIGSAVSLYDREPIKIGDANSVITFFLAGFVLLTTVTWYVAVMTKGGMKAQYPFARPDTLALQVLCSMGAVVYWIYSGRKTGLFVHKHHDHN
jgi:hypothetical protein